MPTLACSLLPPAAPDAAPVSAGLPGPVRVGDVTDFGRGLLAWDAIYEQLAPGRFEGCAEELWIDDGLEILWETGNRSVWTAGSNRAGMVSLGIPVAGGGAGMYCGVPLRDGAVSWLPGGGDFEIFSRERMDIVSATVSESLLRAFAAIDSPRTTEASLRCRFIRQQPRRAEMLRRALIEIVVAARRQPGLLEIPASRVAMRDCVLSLMLDTLGLLHCIGISLPIADTVPCSSLLNLHLTTRPAGASATRRGRSLQRMDSGDGGDRRSWNTRPLRRRPRAPTIVRGGGS